MHHCVPSLAQESPRLLSHQSSIGRGYSFALAAVCLLTTPALAWQTPGYYRPQPGYSARPAIDPRSMPYTAAAETPLSQVTPYGPLPGPPRQPQPAFRPNDWPSATASDQGGPAGPYPVTNAAQPGQTLRLSAEVQPINDVQ